MQSQTAVDLTQTARAPAQEPRGGSLTITARYDLPQPVLIVVGELDRTSMPLLVAMLEHAQPLAQDPGWIAVDLTRVTCTDSHGLLPLLRRHVHVPSASGPVLRVSSLVRPSEPMQAGSEDGVPAGA
jgi:ABC-type transporter Mla MlaB component